MFLEPIEESEEEDEVNYIKNNTYWPVKGNFSYKNLQGYAHFLPKHKPIWEYEEYPDIIQW